MAKIPKIDLLAHALDGQPVVQDVRPYLGMSQIGHECDRYLYMYVHQLFRQELTAQQLRIFERGDMEEPRIYKDLEKIPGVKIEGTQDRMSDFDNRFRGHCDGKILGVPTAEKTWHVLEIKTMNDKAFKEFKKHGMEKAKPGYWVQGQMYMGYLKLNRILWIVTNKNNEARGYERAHFDKDMFEFYRARAKRILEATELPDRIGSGPHYFQCKWCGAKDVCYAE